MAKSDPLTTCRRLFLTIISFDPLYVETVLIPSTSETTDLWPTSCQGLYKTCGKYMFLGPQSGKSDKIEYTSAWARESRDSGANARE